VLRSGQTLSGRVTSAVTGKPVSDACVLIADSAGDGIDLTLTSLSGRYALAHLGAASYEVEASLCLSADPTLAGVIRRDVGVGRARATSGVDVALPDAGSLTGTVSAGSPAAPAPGACVEATPVGGDGQAGGAVTGSDGRYTVAGLAPGRYQVLFTDACLTGVAGLTPAQTSSPVIVIGLLSTSVSATLAAEGSVTGTVTSAATSKPLAGICVAALASAAASEPEAVTATGASGGYALGYLPSGGSYVVRFSSGCGASGYATQWWRDAGSAASATPVRVSAGAASPGIDAAMRP
jgi:hypothetical protein